MKMSESIKNVAAAIAAVQSDLPAIAKDRDNPITHSKYATLDAINKALLPITAKNGLAITQYPVSDAGAIGCGTLILHTSGEYINYDPYLITIDSNKRMSAAQEGGSTITYAKRYQLSAIFGVVTDEDSDGNYNNQNNNGSNPSQQHGNNQGKRSTNNTSKPTGNTPTSQQVTTLKGLFKATSNFTGKPVEAIQSYYAGQVGIKDIGNLDHDKANELIDRITKELNANSKKGVQTA